MYADPASTVTESAETSLVEIFPAGLRLSSLNCLGSNFCIQHLRHLAREIQISQFRGVVHYLVRQHDASSNFEFCCIHQTNLLVAFMASEMLSYICTPLNFFKKTFFGITNRQNNCIDE
jgi:hypothetical protein